VVVTLNATRRMCQEWKKVRVWCARTRGRGMCVFLCVIMRIFIHWRLHVSACVIMRVSVCGRMCDAVCLCACVSVFVSACLHEHVSVQVHHMPRTCRYSALSSFTRVVDRKGRPSPCPSSSDTPPATVCGSAQRMERERT
jgi:hypothetical protein